MSLLDGAWAKARPRAAAADGTLFVASDREVSAATVDSPIWRRRFDAEVVAVAAAAGEVGVLLANGSLLRLAIASGELLAVGPRLDAVRSLMVAWDVPRFAVLTAGGAWVTQGDRSFEVSFERPLAGALDRTGSLLWLTGLRRRAALAELPADLPPDLSQVPPPPHDCHAITDTGFALLPDGLYRFFNERWRRILEAEVGMQLASNRAGSLVAWQSGDRAVSFARYAERKLSDPEVVTCPGDGDVAIAGLAFAEKQRVLVALTDGSAHLLSRAPGRITTLAPHPGAAAEYTDEEVSSDIKPGGASQREAAAPVDSGRMVTHAKFGPGRVLREFDDKLEIDFGAAGVKTLQARFVTPA